MLKNARRVAVTGVGMISCLGSGSNLNFERLLKNDCGITVLPDNDFKLPSNISGSIDSSFLENEIKIVSKHQKYCKGSEKNIEINHMSRGTIMGIISAHEALLQAGWLPPFGETSNINFADNDISSVRAGTHFSTGIGDVLEIIGSSQKLYKQGYSGIGVSVMLKCLPNMPGSHISRAWGLRGPCLSCNTACATGLHSIGEAYRMIQYGEADMVVAGGCEASICPWSLASFSRIRALTSVFNNCPEQASRPFDSKRQGFVIAEGAGALVLEAWPTPDHLKSRLIRPVTQPLGEIIGFGRSADAYGLVSPEPTGDGAFRSMECAMEDAGLVNLDEVGHINCHATSTPLGDAIELAALARLLSRYTRRDGLPPIFLNSIKGHLGHCLGAAGAVAAVYSVLSAQTGRMAPNRNLHQPIDHLEVANTIGSGKVTDEAMEAAVRLFTKTSLTGAPAHHTSQPGLTWMPSGDRRRIITNSFGFGGTNASIIFAEWRD